MIEHVIVFGMAGPHQPYDQGFRWVLQLDPVGLARSVLGIDVPDDAVVAATEYLSRSVKGDGLLIAGDVPIAQIEAQANRDDDLELRLLEYGVGGMRRFGRLTPMVVVLLHPRADRYGGAREWVAHDRRSAVTVQYRVVRLWELPPDAARSSVLLSVLLPLTRATDDRARVALLREAYRRAAGHHDRPRALELGFWTGMLATLYLPEPTITAVQREEAPTMGVSLKDLPGGQWLLAEGREKGLEEGREKGLEEARRAMAQLVRRQAGARFGAEPRLDVILDLDIQRLTEVGEQLLAPEATIEAVVALAQRKG